MDDEDPEVHNIKGLIYFALKEYGEAEKSYKEAIEIKSDYSEARYNLCGLYLTLDQWDKAIDECSIAVSDVLYRSRDKAFTSLGVAYFRKGDFDKAKECYQKSLEVNPGKVLDCLAHLIALPGITVEDYEQVETALRHCREGIDFADALHHAASHACDELLTFDDRRYVRRATRLGFKPPVRLLAP